MDGLVASHWWLPASFPCQGPKTPPKVRDVWVNSPQNLKLMTTTTFRIFRLWGISMVLSLPGISLQGSTPEDLLPENLIPELRPLAQEAQSSANRFLQEATRMEEARGDKRSADAAALPKVHLHTRVVGQYEERINAQSENFDSSRVIIGSNLQLTQPLYAWGSIEASKEMGLLRQGFTEASVQQNRQGLFLQLRSLVLDLLIAHRSTDLASENLTLVQRLENTQNILHQRGDASTQQWLEAGIAVQEAQENLASAQARTRQIEGQINQLAGSSALDTLHQYPFPDFAPLPLETISLLATRARQQETLPEIAAQGHLEFEKANYKRLQANNKPHLELIVGAFSDAVDDFRPDGVETIPRIIGFAGLQARWNLFDGFENRGRKIASLARQRRHELTRQEITSRTRHEIAEILEELKLGASQIEGRAQRVDLITRRFELLEAEQQAGRLSITDLLEERLRLERTRQNLLQARKNYLMNFTRLYILAHGDPLEQATGTRP